MWYDLGLALSVALGLNLATVTLRGSRRREHSLLLPLLGLLGATWAAGELVVQHAAGPEQLVIGRRILYLGATFIPAVWLGLGVSLQPSRRFSGGMVACWAAIPTGLVFSTLFWWPGFLVDLESTNPIHGPLFPYHMAYSWALSVVGLGLVLRAAWRVGRGAGPTTAFTLGVLAPLAGNGLYVTGWTAGVDPTPIMISVGGLAVWIGIIQSGLTSRLPVVFSEILEQLDVGVLVADFDGQPCYCNAEMRRLAGDRVERCENVESVLEQLANCPDMQIETRTVSLSAPGALRVGEAVIAVDRTEAARTEKRLHLSARLESLGQLTAGVAHEINNPLAYIASNLSHLEKLISDLSGPSDPGVSLANYQASIRDGAEAAADIREGIEHIAHIVKQLTIIGSADSGAGMEEVDLVEVARNAARFAGLSRERVEIELDLADVPSVAGRSGELVQVVLNLLLNAIQADPSASEISLRVEAHPVEGAVLSVRDRGPGIPAESMDRVFDPFFTTKSPGLGSGLGLSVSRELTRAHGGDLKVSNRSGGGAEFTLWLPASANQRSESMRSLDEKTPSSPR